MDTIHYLKITRCMALAVLMIVPLGQSAFAAATRASTGTSPHAQASLDFRIVIPETVRMDARYDQIGRAPRFTSKTSERRGNLVVVTIAKP